MLSLGTPEFLDTTDNSIFIPKLKDLLSWLEGQKHDAQVAFSFMIFSYFKSTTTPAHLRIKKQLASAAIQEIQNLIPRRAASAKLHFY